MSHLTPVEGQPEPTVLFRFLFYFLMQQILFSPVSPSTAQKLTEGRKCINKSQSLPKGNRKYIIDSKYLTLK